MIAADRMPRDDGEGRFPTSHALRSRSLRAEPGRDSDAWRSRKLELSVRQRARYRIEWDDGRTSSYTPATGALQLAPETAKRAG